MAGVSGSSWPIPFVVPPCSQSANLRNRHKVPRCSGGRIARLGAHGFRTVTDGESYAWFSSPTALGGYRPWRCQVAEKGPPIGAERAGIPTQTRPPQGPAAVSLATSTSRQPGAIRRWRCFRPVSYTHLRAHETD